MLTILSGNWKKLHTANFTIVVSSLRMLPANKLYMYILFCYMIPIHGVRPNLELDMQLLENELNNGHKDGELQDITTLFIEGWDLHWCNSNDAFESFLSLDVVLVMLKSKDV